MYGLTQCFFFVLLSIGAFSVEATAPISNDIAKEISKHFSERQSRQSSCPDIRNWYNIDDFSSVISMTCKTAAQNHPSNPIKEAICTSACNDLYQLLVLCFGAESTQIAYKQLCSNGYQGGSAGQATAHYTVVVLSLVAAAFVLRTML